MMTKKHLTKKWEISIIKFQSNTGAKFKVTRRLPEMLVAKTKIFKSKKKAKMLFEKWLK